VDLDFAVHPRLELMVQIQNVDDDGEHRDVLIDLRLRLDFQNAAVERAIGTRPQ